MARSQVMQSVREFIREPYAFPGGYPKVLIMSDSECLCAKCAKANYRLISKATRHNDRRDEWHAEGVDLHLEGPPAFCAHCNAETESAYGEPESE
jgi:hypothetical protein